MNSTSMYIFTVNDVKLPCGGLGNIINCPAALYFIASSERLLFLNEDHFMLIVECVVQIEQARMMQLIHNSNLVTDRVLVRLFGCVYKLSDKIASR